MWFLRLVCLAKQMRHEKSFRYLLSTNECHGHLLQLWRYLLGVLHGDHCNNFPGEKILATALDTSTKPPDNNARGFSLKLTSFFPSQFFTDPGLDGDS